jgi:hypothetical protein
MSLPVQPRTHTVTLGKRHRLRDGFFTRAEQVLVGAGRGAQYVDDGPFPRLPSDNDVPVFRARAAQG